jgi:hypothetical protein
LSYYEIVRKGYTGLRGALKRVVFDESLSIDDVVSISNTPIEQPTQEYITMARTKRTTQTTNKQTDGDTRISFNEALLVVSHSLKSDADLLRLEQLISKGISRTELLTAFGDIPS